MHSLPFPDQTCAQGVFPQYNLCKFLRKFWWLGGLQTWKFSEVAEINWSLNDQISHAIVYWPHFHESKERWALHPPENGKTHRLLHDGLLSLLQQVSRIQSQWFIHHWVWILLAWELHYESFYLHSGGWRPRRVHIEHKKTSMFNIYCTFSFRNDGRIISNVDGNTFVTIQGW